MRCCLPIAFRNCSALGDGRTVREANLGLKVERELTSWYILKGITVSCGAAMESGLRGRKGIAVTYGHLCEVSSKDTRDIVGSENFVFPVEIFAILSFLDAWCLG